MACCENLRALLNPELFRALCEPNRLSLLCCLADRPEARSVGDIARDVPIDRSVVSRHLSQLRACGILEAFKTGREVRYRLNGPKLADFLRRFADAVEQCSTATENLPKTKGKRS